MTERVIHEVPHHFDSAEQAFETSKLGMWAFLVTEVLMFGGLFVGYAAFRYLYPEMFIHAHDLLDRKMGALNTIVLISSSLSMALAVRAAQTDNQKALVRNLIFTLIFAGTFMVVKYFEYTHKIHDGLLPGWLFTYEGLKEFHQPQIFFGFYFCMTGLHGIHVLAGMVLISWLLWRSKKGHFYPEYYTPVEMVGLFWHLVDLIWIFLFPLFYLIG